MKKIGILFSVILCTGCSYPGLQGNSFDYVWKTHAEETVQRTTERFVYEKAKSNFNVWAENFEKKRSAFIRINEKEELEGKSIIAGTSLSRNIEQYKLSLEKLQTIIDRQEKQKGIIMDICGVQKVSVKCDL